MAAGTRLFVTACFVLWTAASYLCLFALATVFWVAYLESNVHRGAFAEYLGALALTLASCAASLWLWKRVADRPELYAMAARWFAVILALGGIGGGLLAFAIR